MSFEHATVTKGLMMAYALTSIFAGIFDVKHYFHLQFVPHLSRHYQFWRLLTHTLVFSNSSDLLLAELLLYGVAVHIERQFGSVKFASFLIISALLSTILEFVVLVLLHAVGVNHIPSGLTAVIFSILYQWFRLIPPAYRFRIFGVHLSNKSFTYILASQLALGYIPGSVASSCIGVLVGYIYRSEVINVKMWRVSPTVIKLSSRFLLPLIGSTRPPRRLNRARPERTNESMNDEIITTATSSQRGELATGDSTEGSSVVREWVNELTGRTDDVALRIRTPSEIEITQLASMFPDTPRDVIITTLQQSPNVETAVEVLLTTSR